MLFYRFFLLLLGVTIIEAFLPSFIQYQPLSSSSSFSSSLFKDEKVRVESSLFSTTATTSYRLARDFARQWGDGGIIMALVLGLTRSTLIRNHKRELAQKLLEFPVVVLVV